MTGRAAMVALLALLLAACGKKGGDDGAATAAATDGGNTGVVFAKGGPAIGAKIDERQTSRMTLSLRVDDRKGKPKALSSVEDSATTAAFEVLGVNGDAVTKLKVTYVDDSRTSTIAGKAVKRPGPLAGKAFVLEAGADGKLVVRDDRGRPVPAGTASLIAHRFPSFGRVSPVAASMPTRVLREAEKVLELTRGFEEELTALATEMTVKNVRVALKEQKADEGVFTVEAQLAKNDGPRSMLVDLAGEARVRRSDSALLAVTLAGPIAVTTNPDPRTKAKVDGSGKMELAMTRAAP